MPRKPKVLGAKIKLTRWQIERMMSWVAMNGNIHAVTIQEIFESGIGPSHWITWHREADSGQTDEACDFTDIKDW